MRDYRLLNRQRLFDGKLILSRKSFIIRVRNLDHNNYLSNLKRDSLLFIKWVMIPRFYNT